MTIEDIRFKCAETTDEFEHGRNLFRQYADSLDLDLGFQGFDEELKTIGTQYAAPTGVLWLAYDKEVPVGCTGVRMINEEIAELKRMFVKAEYRKLKIGRILLEQALDIAKARGYTFLRLDTLPAMTQAIALYKAFGFYPIPSYRYNPVADALFMEKKL